VKVFVSPSRDEMGKFSGVVQAFPDIWGGPVLDVGCRSGNLKGVLPGTQGSYCGLDLFPPADIIGNIEADLPFADLSFDTVVALDVLEHTNDIHQAFNNLCRVARRHVLIALPNMYELQTRIKFLFGQRLSGKYGLPCTPPADRHRWFFSLREAEAFVHMTGRQRGFEVVTEGCLVGPRRGFAIRGLVSCWPNLLSPLYVALLRREGMR
jgi:SAM-dependent methyltransferase